MGTTHKKPKYLEIRRKVGTVLKEYKLIRSTDINLL